MASNMEKQKLRSQFGLDATVSRETLKGDKATKANRELMEIGADLNPIPDNLEHLGSGAFHVYFNKTLKQVFFVHQADKTITKLPEVIAQYATKDFIGTIMEHFGQKRPTWRSGF